MKIIKKLSKKSRAVFTWRGLTKYVLNSKNLFLKKYAEWASRVLYVCVLGTEKQRLDLIPEITTQGVVQMAQKAGGNFCTESRYLHIDIEAEELCWTDEARNADFELDKIITEQSVILGELEERNRILEEKEHAALQMMEEAKRILEKSRQDIESNNERIEDARKTVKNAQETKYKKKSIPKTLKVRVWDMYIGIDKQTHKCLCCEVNEISQNSFHAGHVIPESKGGAFEHS